MNVINFERGYCGRIRSYLDSYLDGELLIEPDYEVLQHLQSCSYCSEELEMLARVKRLLQKAVQHERARSALRQKIQSEIRSTRNVMTTAPPWGRFALVVSFAVALLVTIVVTIQSHNSTIRATLKSEQAHLEPARDLTMKVLDIGLDEHAYCALHWQFPKAPPTLDKVAKNIGPEYAALARLVEEKMSKDYHLEEAHRCRHNEREFTHFILRNGQLILSFIVTRKNDDDLLPADAIPDWQVAGVSIYRERERGQEIAGFETSRHFVFVASGLDRKDNMQIASTLAPYVHDFLAKLEG